jgi:hypothetical protein
MHCCKYACARLDVGGARSLVVRQRLVVERHVVLERHAAACAAVGTNIVVCIVRPAASVTEPWAGPCGVSRSRIAMGRAAQQEGEVGMSRMDAPHLTVAIYPDPDDDRTVEDIADLLLERGARPHGNGFYTEGHRRMLVQRVPSSDGHDAARSVEIVMSAGPLGDPGYSRREVASCARYLTDLLTAVAERTRPLYGGIGVESIFPSPADLRGGVLTQGVVSDPLFVRRDLLARSDLASMLAREYRRSIEGPAGTIFASRWPFIDGRPATPGGLSIWETWAGGRQLGRVTARYIRACDRNAQERSLAEAGRDDSDHPRRGDGSAGYGMPDR